MDYDLLVIGSGPGGTRAAIAAAKRGKRVCIIERKPYIGGVSLQTGTIPSKALREASFLSSRFSTKGMRELFSRQQVDGTAFLKNAIIQKGKVIEGKEAVLGDQLKRNGVDLIHGEASFVDANTLEVKNEAGDVRLLSTDYIIVATGSRPRRPDGVPFDRRRVLDSTSVMKLSELPESMIIVGGGVIACEFATIFAPLGVRVTLIDSHEQVLGYLDSDITDELVVHMREMGVELYMNARIGDITLEGERVRIDAGEKSITADALLYAMGRVPNYESLKIENVGLEASDRGWIPVNEQKQSAVPNIYFIGDIIGSPALASTAMEQGRLAALHAFGETRSKSVSPLPMAIYTIPELSYVGETERELKARGADYAVGRCSFHELARGQIIGEEHGMLKLIADRETHRILGVHIIGEAASELIHIAQMIMAFEGRLEMLADNVFNFPTLAESYKVAAMDCLHHMK